MGSADFHNFERQPTAGAARQPHRGGGLFMLGLQGRLILSFLFLIAVALGSSCWLFANQSADQLTELISEQALTLANTLARAAEPSLAGGRKAELSAIGHDLLNSRNILYIAFLNANHQPLALANRYVDFSWKDVSTSGTSEQSLYRACPRNSPAFGDYVDVFVPVIALQTRPVEDDAAKKPQRILGYVAVAISLDHEKAQMQLVNWIVAGIGVAVVLLSLPVAYLLVFNIFKPIRKLVHATQEMANGKLDIQLDIARDDLIGELTASFDEMVNQVRRQREDLASTNGKLADANKQLGNANAQLAEANRDLEDKVQMRTGQLETANSRLSAEVAEKEDFLRAVSHDLNAPLRNIAGMAAMLLTKNRDKFDEDVIHRLERIQKNVQVETELISELLELSRIKSRRHRMEHVDTEGIVRDLAGVFEEDLTSKKIEMIFDTPLPALMAERARVRQVFQNLIDNAIKYMGDRPVREIRIGCHLAPEEVSFYVRDTGIGIDEEEVPKVFHVFRRGKSAAVQNIAGKGVGLASVKSIIETYNGTIWVESKVGEGSTFRFTINGKYVATDGVEQPFNPESLPEEESGADRQAA
jgi:signal transduction histidine kinase